MRRLAHSRYAMTTAEAKLVKMSRSQRLIFVADHPGFQDEIARECGVSQPFVSLIFHGKRSTETPDGARVLAAIERYLAKESA